MVSQLAEPTEQLPITKYPVGKHPNSLKNLEKRTSWLPGQSGNPRGVSLKAHLDTELERSPTMEHDGFDGKGKTNAQLIIQSQVRDARTGDNAARKEIWEREEGKVTEKHELAGADGGALPIAIVGFQLVPSTPVPAIETPE